MYRMIHGICLRSPPSACIYTYTLYMHVYIKTRGIYNITHVSVRRHNKLIAILSLRLTLEPKTQAFPNVSPTRGVLVFVYSVSLSYKQCVSCDSESDTASRLASPASGLLARDWLGGYCRAMPFVMLYVSRLCQHRVGKARRLRSAPDSMDARRRTSPHSSVYFLNRPLFGLTSVGREYLRKRGRKSVENKGKGKKLSVIETAPRCSWLRQSCRVLGAIKIGHPSSRAG